MRKLSSVISGIGLSLLLGVFIFGCGGGGGNLATTSLPNSGEVSISDQPLGAGNFVGEIVGAQDSSLPKNISVTEEVIGSQTIISISVEDADNLKSFLYELRYDSTYHNPVKVEFSDFLGSEDEVITYAHTAYPSVVALAAIKIHPDEVEGVSGSGEVAKIYFENRPFVNRSVSKTISDLAPVEDFTLLDATDPAAITFGWTASFFRGDGTQDGTIDIQDISPIAENFGTSTADNEAATVADYTGDQLVDIQDISVVAEFFFVNVTNFKVKVATDAADGTYNDDGLVVSFKDDALPDPASTGFNQYEAALTQDYSGFDTIWARIYYEDADGNTGPDSDAVEVQLGAPPPPLQNILIDGAVIEIEGASGGGGPDGDWWDSENDGSGEVTANSQISVSLVGIHYQYLTDGLYYGVDVPGLNPVEGLAPAGLENEYNELLANLKERLASSVTVTPGDPRDVEFFTADPVNPGDTVFTGTVGPNDVDEFSNMTPNTISVSAELDPDNQYTGGVQVVFTTDVVLTITEDPTAPELWYFDPVQATTQEAALVNIAVDFGNDDWPTDQGGTNDQNPYTATPVLVQLVDIDTGGDWFFIDPFTDDEVVGYVPDPAGADSPNPPSAPGYFTYQILDPEIQRPGEPGDPSVQAGPTAFIQVWMKPVGALPPESSGIFHWRVIDSNGNVASSIFKPFDENGQQVVFTFTAPQPLTFATWPVDNIYAGFNGAEFLYVFPEDPKIRVNPHVHMEIIGEPPNHEIVRVPDDETRFNIIRREPLAENDEFVIEYGDPFSQPPTKDAPIMVYGIGDVDIDSLDDPNITGELPAALYLHPHMIGFAMQQIDLDLQADGPVTLALFSQGGTKLGQTVKTFVKTRPPRTDMYVAQGADENVRDDFGVNPWGDDGSLPAPDWSNKTASKSNYDLLVLEAHNLWIRHKAADDNLDPSDIRRASVLVFEVVDSGAEVPDFQVLPRIIDVGDPSAPMIVSIDISQPMKFRNQPPLELNPGQYYLRWKDPFSNNYSDYYRDADGNKLVLAIAP